jgi:DNA-binding MarR family transcriptional regulator
VAPSLHEPEEAAKYKAAARFAQVQAAKGDRARRTQHLPSELFAEPAWDILLELYAFELIGREVTQSELLIRVSAPSSTSLRWVKMLDAEGLVTRRAHTGEADSSITLTSKSVHALEAYFDTATSPLGSAGDKLASGSMLGLVRGD